MSTLTTEQVRGMIARAPVEGLRDWKIEFDRWLADHDRKTWDAGAVAGVRYEKQMSRYRMSDTSDEPPVLVNPHQTSNGAGIGGLLDRIADAARESAAQTSSHSRPEDEK